MKRILILGTIAATLLGAAAAFGHLTSGPSSHVPAGATIEHNPETCRAVTTTTGAGWVCSVTITAPGQAPVMPGKVGEAGGQRGPRPLVASCTGHLFTGYGGGQSMYLQSYDSCTELVAKIEQYIGGVHCILYIGGCVVWQGVWTGNPYPCEVTWAWGAWCPTGGYMVWNNIPRGWLVAGAWQQCVNFPGEGWACNNWQYGPPMQY